MTAHVRLILGRLKYSSIAVFEDDRTARVQQVRAAVEHVFARQKGPMGLVVRTIGIARATVKIGLANITYNMKRAVWLTERATMT